MKMLVMHLNMIKRVASNELVRETGILRVQDNKSIVFYMVTR